MSTLRSAIDELDGDDLSKRSNGGLRDDVAEIARSIDLLTFHLQRRVTEVGRRGGHADEGFANVTRWLAVTADTDGSTARRHVSAGRTLADNRETGRRFGSGDLSWWRSRVLSRAADAHPDEFQRDEEMLLDLAAGLSHRDFPRAVRHWVNCAEATLDTAERHERTYLHASALHDGMVKIDGLLDQQAGETLLTALDTATPPPPAGEASPASHRRADALTEICRQWLESGAGSAKGGVRPHVSLVVDLETLLNGHGRRCDLDFTGPVHPPSALSLLCDASVSRILTDARSQPLDVGRSIRTVSAAQRRALVVRDGGCRFPGCDRPPAWCDAHHIVHWIHGGPSDLGNLVLLCRHHHTVIHSGLFKIAVDHGSIRFERNPTPGPEP